MTTESSEAAPLVRVRTRHGGSVAVIALDSPANRNALSRPLMWALGDALNQVAVAARDLRVRAVVLTHTEPAFCSGADLRERAADRARVLDGGSAAPSAGHALAGLIDRLMSMPVPTIAAIGGPVRAGGIGLMAACDLVVLHPSVDLAFTEVRIGVAPAVISVPVLARCPWSAVATPFLTGANFDAAAAAAMGLATHVVDDVSTTVDGLCEAILAGAPGAVVATKRLLRDRSADQRLLSEMATVSDDLFTSDEAVEGMAAFLERRPPSWRQASSR